MTIVDSSIETVINNFKHNVAPTSAFDNLRMKTRKLNTDLGRLDSESIAQALAEKMPEGKKQEKLAESYQRIGQMVEALQDLMKLIQEKLINPIKQKQQQS